MVNGSCVSTRGCSPVLLFKQSPAMETFSVEDLSPTANMARFQRALASIFEKYEREFSNDIILNLNTMEYDTPNGPRKWKGQEIMPPIKKTHPEFKEESRIAYPEVVIDPSEKGNNSHLSVALPQNDNLELTKPAASDIHNTTFIISNDQHMQCDTEVRVNPLTNKAEQTKPAASDINNTTFIVSNDQHKQGGTEVMVKPLPNKAISHVEIPPCATLHLRQKEQTKPIASDINNTTFILSNDQHEQGGTEVMVKPLTNKAEQTKPAASDINNTTFIVSNDQLKQGDTEVMVKPLTNKADCDPLKNLFEMKTGKRYTADLDFLIEDETLPQYYELQVKEEQNGLMLLQDKKRMIEKYSDFQNETMNNIDCQKSNGAFYFSFSPTKPTKKPTRFHETLCNSSGYCSSDQKSLEILNVEENENDSIYSADEDLPASDRSMSSLGDLYPALVDQIYNSLHSSFARQTTSTWEKTHKTKGQSCKRPKLNISRNRLPFQYSYIKRRKKLKYSRYCLRNKSCSSISDTENVNDVSHSDSIKEKVEESRSCLVNNDVSLTENCTFPNDDSSVTLCNSVQSLAATEKYEEGLSGLQYASKKVDNEKSLIANVQSSLCNSAVTQKSQMAAITSSVAFEGKEFYDNSRNGIPRCKYLKSLQQSVLNKTFTKLPFSACKSDFITKEDNQAASIMEWQREDNQSCPTGLLGGELHNKVDSSDLKMRCTLQTRKVLTLKPLKEMPLVETERAFDEVHRRLCLENSAKPQFERTFVNSKSFNSLEKSNPLISSPFYKKVKRNNAHQDDDPLMPSCENLKEMPLVDTERAFNEVHRRLCLENSAKPQFERTFLNSKSFNSLEKSNPLISSPFYKKVKRNKAHQDDDPLMPSCKRQKNEPSNLNSIDVQDYLFNGAHLCPQKQILQCLPVNAASPSKECYIGNSPNMLFKMSERCTSICKTPLNPKILFPKFSKSSGTN
ncbi:Holliday junction recognition protein isoform X2 [Ambystoma mexicanum]|uniref:Holliday junction recognition protein isoform X2 n=1 Tax=Ambystoma mexicanum TaxID=8296 RepID=UPI0037E707D4